MLEWKQTPKTITIQKTVGFKVNAKNITSEITDSYIKMNVPDHKIFMHIDLFGEIDMETSKIVIEDKNIFIYLDKCVENIWPRLEFLDKNNREEYNAMKPQLEERRRNAKDKYEKRMKELEEIAAKQRKENEKYIVDKSIKLDEEKKRVLKEKKTEEKTTAENDLYKFISDYKEKEEEQVYRNEILDTKPIEPTIREVTEEEIIMRKAQEDKKTAQTAIISISKKNEIFEKEEIIATPQTEIRQQSNFKVNLTEKAIPHFAARESLTKEPPYPKSKKFVPEKNMVIYN
jgi:hypothetical protein